MKTLSFPIISFLLFSVCINSLFCPAAAALEPPVLDASGENLKPGPDDFYYIVSIFTGAGGGGVRQVSTGNATCPLAVIQSKFDIDYGTAVWFNQVGNPIAEVIRESTDINIQFIATSLACDETSVWKRDDSANSLGQYFITTGGVKGFHGIDAYVTSRFKIQKSIANGYKLVYCPVCAFCDHVCSDIGIVVQNGTRRLALGDVPFNVVFIKASSILRQIVE